MVSKGITKILQDHVEKYWGHVAKIIESDTSRIIEFHLNLNEAFQGFKASLLHILDGTALKTLWCFITD